MDYNLPTGKQNKYIGFVFILLFIFCSMNESFAQSAMKASRESREIETAIEAKPHYILHADNPEQRAYLIKCIAKYAYWHRHRMLNKRRIIEIEAPYNAKIELYSEYELHKIYGKRILPGISDNEADFLNLSLQVTPNGLKESIK
jgi:hypothetical protein